MTACIYRTLDEASNLALHKHHRQTGGAQNSS